MAEIINYIWQSTICLLIFYGIYWGFLKDEKAFGLTRVFILLSPVMAILFPLIEIPVEFSKPSISLEHTDFLKSLSVIPTQEETVGMVGLPEFTVQGTKLPLLLEIKDYLLIGYLGMLFLLGLRLSWQFLQLRMLLRKGWYQTTFNLRDNYFLVPTFGMAPVFSFFDKIFWDETQDLRADEKDHILKHEIEHIRQGHSWDVLYYQILSILFWFNPAIHLMRSALVETHEYLVDAHVLKRTDNQDSYRKLIVKIAFKGLDLPIGNSFIRSTTLKRIMMMKNPSKINWLKLAMVLPLTAMLLGMVSLKTMLDPTFPSGAMTEDIQTIKKQIDAARDSIQVTAKVKKLDSPVHYEYVNGLMEGKITAQIGHLQYEIGEINAKEEYQKVLEMLQVFKDNTSFNKDYGMENLVRQAEKMPTPEAGMDAWNKFLSSNLKMPAEARALGVDGTVYAEFIVDKAGRIISPVIRKSLGMGLDDEVLRILSLPAAPRWIPGEKDGETVNTLMTIPVRFKSDQTTESRPFYPLSPTPPSLAAEVINGEPVFNIVQKRPIPAGGMEGWKNYRDNNLKYPEAAKNAGIEGTVYVAFVIDKEGNVINPSVLRGIGGGADEEALRLVQAAPKWTPGMQGEQKVNVQVRMPIQFKLPSNNHGGRDALTHPGQNEDSGKPTPGTLNTVFVRGYGSNPDYVLNTSDRNIIKITLTAKDNILINGKKVEWDELKKEISHEAEKLIANKIPKDQIIASIVANEKIKVGQVQDIQNILRTLGIRKITYSNFE